MSNILSMHSLARCIIQLRALNLISSYYSDSTEWYIGVLFKAHAACHIYTNTNVLLTNPMRLYMEMGNHNMVDIIQLQAADCIIPPGDGLF